MNRPRPRGVPRVTFNVFTATLRELGTAGVPWPIAWNTARTAALETLDGRRHEAISEALYATYGDWKFAFMAEAASVTPSCPVVRLMPWGEPESAEGLSTGRFVA